MNPEELIANRSRSVVVTGASRGLGLATAVHLARRGWTVLAAMRAPEVGTKRMTEALGASFDEKRLIGVELDLDDPASIDRAASEILDRVGAPDGIVHNAGVAGVGSVEEMPVDVIEDMFTTNLFGPIRLTQHLLPAMRISQHGRIVVVSTAGAVTGMPATSSYSASKSALERWAESLSMEMSRFQLGVTVLVVGTFKTDILELTPRWTEEGGPYAPLHTALDAVGDKMLRIGRRPERFASCGRTRVDRVATICAPPGRDRCRRDAVRESMVADTNHAVVDHSHTQTPTELMERAP